MFKNMSIRTRILAGVVLVNLLGAAVLVSGLPAQDNKALPGSKACLDCHDTGRRTGKREPGVPPAFDAASLKASPHAELECASCHVELEKIKGYRTLLNETIGGGKYPPECIAIRTNEWKLILRQRRELLEQISWWNFISGTRFPVEEIELYDLRNDPLEQKNVARQNPLVVEKLKARLLAWDGTFIREQQAPSRGKQPHMIIPYP